MCIAGSLPLVAGCITPDTSGLYERVPASQSIYQTHQKQKLHSIDDSDHCCHVHYPSLAQ
jgi:hypothetical protein